MGGDENKKNFRILRFSLNRHYIYEDSPKESKLKDFQMLQLKLFFQDKIKGKKVTEKTKFPKKKQNVPFWTLVSSKKISKLK